MSKKFKTIEDLLQAGFECVRCEETVIGTISEYWKYYEPYLNVRGHLIRYEVCECPDGEIEIERV